MGSETLTTEVVVAIVFGITGLLVALVGLWFGFLAARAARLSRRDGSVGSLVSNDPESRYYTQPGTPSPTFKTRQNSDERTTSPERQPPARLRDAVLEVPPADMELVHVQVSKRIRAPSPCHPRRVNSFPLSFTSPGLLSPSSSFGPPSPSPSSLRPSSTSQSPPTLPCSPAPPSASSRTTQHPTPDQPTPAPRSRET